jgi:hypothetical protein
MRERVRKLNPSEALPSNQEPLIDDVAALADHVARFSLAGIQAVKAQIERRRRN